MTSRARLTVSDLKLFLEPTGPLVVNLGFCLILGMFAIFLVASGLIAHTFIFPSGVFLGVFGVAGVSYFLGRRQGFSRWCGILANVAFVAAVARDFLVPANGVVGRLVFAVVTLYAFVLPTVFLIRGRGWVTSHES